jgi:hypothetical protein
VRKRRRDWPKRHARNLKWLRSERCLLALLTQEPDLVAAESMLQLLQRAVRCQQLSRKGAVSAASFMLLVRPNCIQKRDIINHLRHNAVASNDDN